MFIEFIQQGACSLLFRVQTKRTREATSKIDKWFPSTKKCSCCGAEKHMTLSERIYQCSCGYLADRDYNSAINIKNEGLRLLALS